LEVRARDRYGALDQMSSELRHLEEQCDALDALVEVLRTDDGWLVYRAAAVRDQILELEGWPTEEASAIEKVRAALIDRDEALQRAREDLAGAHAMAVEWEAEEVSARAKRQRDRTTLEGARSWQSQVEERAKEAEELKARLADKAAAVVTAEEQLRQECAACQEAETQLQQERPALVEARAALERERLAREEARGSSSSSALRSRGVRASLKEREDEVSKLDGELIVLSISHEDQRLSLEEQGPRLSACSRRSRTGAKLSRRRKSRLKVSHCLFLVLLIFPLGIHSQL
jgi:DNA repair exonuclease SbcCD ATPase subunit